ncbi:MAG: hypothetical protein DRR19_23710 [Candidatus Parabeggiatoa sp. nov. 1]|nr:MAG: hypothetical protein DRR19_23710 [Gammaproteobacteria bacterium]
MLNTKAESFFKMKTKFFVFVIKALKSFSKFVFQTTSKNTSKYPPFCFVRWSSKLQLWTPINRKIKGFYSEWDF